MAILDIRQPIRLFAPAKLNLGLEVLRRRADGYHEVVTIMQAVSLFDYIDLLPAAELHYDGAPGIPREADLVWQALEHARRDLGITLAARVRLRKRIPLAAGLGGGSSDAGTLLGVLGALAGLPGEMAVQVAARLGSDVPFFTRGGTALATGTGTDLEWLPPPRQRYWFVIVVPDLAIPSKTATLYRELNAADFSDGEATMTQAQRLRNGEPLDLTLLRNTFDRPLIAYAPVRRAIDALHHAGAGHVLPAGAGSSVFTVTATREHAQSIAARLGTGHGPVFVCSTVPADLNICRIKRTAYQVG
ncbi:4-(cytidine 5'-diphospho)-2-C-methyl-D-erythritol kinase [Nitrolancea hollandica]|uniref:4-diphosphocytidyl-2-C-methyl-D-erythritol kinase n=1 Tax=Nitrolancea hollandica Lb TaxID=1129897 RepID=I4EFI6_9BACT|nr:4-(cytidine 5'-diphospho)-2-C-methyl-D-erythritol kinase [Nitrolancea hollandica]CCF83448.1 4-diphosphocytidyl-2C-methyl-D-erythritolkinase [Nitrolancea hollandica Lb]